MGLVLGAFLNNIQYTEPTSLIIYCIAGARGKRTVKHQLLQVIYQDSSVCLSLLYKQLLFQKLAIEDWE